MEKLERVVQKICGILEMVVAILVLIGIILALCSLFKDGSLFFELLHDIESFKLYLDKILLIVIGIEFLRMLCRPNSDNVIEVIIFLVARHMIVSNNTPYQDFVSVISIILLCLVRQYLHRVGDGKNDEKKS
ncbi:MAG: phosphate-starvation-inducible PsiE family protein [Lachnospiraceae bacterium]